MVRVKTIDALRALTMFFMIFVNDFWTLKNIPEWLKHTTAEVDGMGFSDIIFPLFLFIVGLSIPLSINVRISNGEKKRKIFKHIIQRSFALIVMGVFMVNYETASEYGMIISKYQWEIIMAISIFLIWINYKKIPYLNSKAEYFLKFLGIIFLIFIAVVYEGSHSGETTWMKTSWWGILGLIGWGYLFNSLIYLLLRNKTNFLFIIFLFLMFMNVQENNFFEEIPAFKLIVGASNHLFVLSGILTSIFLVKSLNNRKENLLLKILFVFSIIFLVYGFAIRPSFHISKIYGSPSWVAICTAINLFSFIILFLLVEKTNFNRFLKPIRAAGTSTLTCYLIPYLVYPLLVLIDFSWPEWMIVGTVGLIKSLLFSLLIIVFVRILEKNNIKLKI